MTDPFDPFAEHRENGSTLDAQVGDQQFLMVLGYDDLRAVAADWHTFSSDVPFGVQIPTEKDVRVVRQLPIETNPPEHTACRSLIGDPFSWKTAARIQPEVKRIADELLNLGIEGGSMEIVRSFALPLQSRSLALMLGRSREEADEWISWGTHVFRDLETSATGHATDLDAYLNRAIDEAVIAPGDDFFGLLARARFGDRGLTKAEMLGFANLTFAGGRDTVINSVTNGFYHLAMHPDDLARLQRDGGLVASAAEEFLRFFSPITHLGRIVAKKTELGGRALEPDNVVSMCFASANRDASVFERADECVIDRNPNRHVAFGHGPHRCIGAPQAKTVLSAAIEAFVTRVGSSKVIDARPKVEELGPVRRQTGFDRLVLRLVAA